MSISDRIFLFTLLALSFTCPATAQWVQTSFPLQYRTSSFAVSGSTIFVGTGDGGVFRSTDDGDTWEPVNNGLAGYTSVTALGVTGSKVFAGTYRTSGVYPTQTSRQAIFVSTNAGTSWQPVDTSLGVPSVASFAFDDSGGFAGTHAGTILSTRDGVSWNPLPFAAGKLFTSVYSLATYGSKIFAGLYNPVFMPRASCLHLSTDRGASWHEVTSPGFGYVVALASVGTTLIAATEYTLYQSTDDGVSWRRAGDGLRSLIQYGWVNSLVARAGGSTGNLNLFVGAYVSQEPGDTNSYTGIFLSTDSGATWAAVKDSVPRLVTPSYQVQFLAATGTSLFVRTSGDGIWRRPLSEMITSVTPAGGGLPQEFDLQQNYPNPFNPTTTIRYGLPARSHVTLTVYNTLGQQVATLVEGEREAGYHEVVFDASDVSSGMYLYSLRAGSSVQTRRLLVVR